MDVIVTLKATIRDVYSEEDLKNMEDFVSILREATDGVIDELELVDVQKVEETE